MVLLAAGSCAGSEATQPTNVATTSEVVDDPAPTATVETAGSQDGDWSISSADWPMYNQSVNGSRHNDAETALTRETASDLTVKWRSPAEGQPSVGAIHVTPAVVNGNVYFGTASPARMYKLRPDGTLAWEYDLPPESAEGCFNKDERTTENDAVNFINALGGILSLPLVTETSVYCGDTLGTFTDSTASPAPHNGWSTRRPTDSRTPTPANPHHTRVQLLASRSVTGTCASFDVPGTTRALQF